MQNFGVEILISPIMVKMEKAYIKAFQLAKEKMKVIYTDRNTVDVNYFGEKYEIKLPEIEFLNDENLSDREKILILHYLTSEIPDIEEKFISFKEIKTGNIYYPSIISRVHTPLIEKFSKSPEEFLKKAISLGAKKREGEKYSVLFNVFPEIQLIINFYPEDEEFPADVQILFNSKTGKILNIEDIVIMCEELIEKLIK